MEARTPVAARSLAAIAVVGLLLGAVLSLSFIDSQQASCCGRLVPYVSIYHDPLSKLDVTLAGGDGHAFAAIAEDPTLSRPQVFRIPAEFAYRAQRPVWGYLTWAASGGQARFVGWTLVVLTILSCGLACGVTGYLLAVRGRSVWWALGVPLFGFETLSEMTPELFVLALVGIGLVLWHRDRHALAAVVFSVAALTREQSIVAVGALALWSLWHATGSARRRIRGVRALVVPPLVYVAWVGVVRVRLGDWPLHASRDRLSLPGVGVVRALEHSPVADSKLVWIVVGLVLCALAVAWARRDVLTWIAVAYAAFGTVLGYDVWHSEGFQRTLLPLYVFAGVAALGGFVRRPTRTAESAGGSVAATDERVLTGVR